MNQLAANQFLVNSILSRLFDSDNHDLDIFCAITRFLLLLDQNIGHGVAQCQIDE